MDKKLHNVNKYLNIKSLKIYIITNIPKFSLKDLNFSSLNDLNLDIGDIL